MCIIHGLLYFIVTRLGDQWHLLSSEVKLEHLEQQYLVEMTTVKQTTDHDIQRY